MRDAANSIPRYVKNAVDQINVFSDLPQVSDRWAYYLLSLAVMIALASLDFVGSILAKEWTLRSHPGFFLAGMASFVILFVVFANSLRIAELSVVTFGWIVFLQIGVLLVDRLRYGVVFPPGKWIAIVVMLALQAYLVLAPNDAQQTETP